MSRGAVERRKLRNRVYLLVTGLLILIIGVVAMAAFYTVGTTQMDQKVYTSPKRTLEFLSQAQDRFRLQDLDQDGEHDFARSLEELEAAQQITSRLVDEEVRGYRYRVVSADAMAFSLVATPSDPSQLSYYVDQTHIIRAAEGGSAGPQSDIFFHPVHGELWSLRQPPLETTPEPEATPAPEHEGR